MSIISCCGSANGHAVLKTALHEGVAARQRRAQALVGIVRQEHSGTFTGLDEGA